MSLLTPRIQALSTYKTQESRRNISSPYSLAIPPRKPRRSTNTSTNTGTPSKSRIIPKNSSDTLQVPKLPKKAVIVSEKPIRPYPYSGKSTSTILLELQHTSPYVPAPTKSRFGGKINDRVLALSVTLTLALLLAIGILLGIFLPRKLIHPLPLNVLIPFYVYPDPGAWDELYDAVVKYENTNFIVVVNPDNGPGSSVWPSAEYINAIKALNVYPNVQTLGYINTTGGSCDMATIRSEIATYAGWSNVSENLALDGIFFDKTPYQDEGDARMYLTNISVTVRQSEKFGEKALVVQNPGRMPDEALMAYKPNVTVVFEGSYDDLPRKEQLRGMLEGKRCNRQNYALLVHSVPDDIGRVGLRKIVDDVRRDVEWLYVTDLTKDVYAGYGSLLGEWMDVMW